LAGDIEEMQGRSGICRPTVTVTVTVTVTLTLALALALTLTLCVTLARE